MKRPLTTTSVRKLRAGALLFFAACSLGARDFGPPTGSRFPAFNLPDQNGQLHSLRSLIGPKGAVILVYKPGDQCPFCKVQLAELEQHREAFHKLGVGLTALSLNSLATLKEFAGREALPGWFVLNARGVIVAKYFEDDANQSYTSAGILVDQLGWSPDGPKREVEGKQITATVAASNSIVAPGQRIALTLDLELGPNMHVYAPGVEGYIPIDWKMQDSPTAQVHAPVFPAAEKLYLRAIDETVPAYRNHFRLTRDITIPGEDRLKPALDGSGHFKVGGSLRYQACDDRVCYIPQELPLQWSFALAP